MACRTVAPASTCLPVSPVSYQVASLAALAAAAPSSASAAVASSVAARCSIPIAAALAVLAVLVAVPPAAPSRSPPRVDASVARMVLESRNPPVLSWDDCPFRILWVAVYGVIAHGSRDVVGVAHRARLAGVATVVAMRPAVAPIFEALHVWWTWSKMRVGFCLSTLSLVARLACPGLHVSSPTATAPVAAYPMATASSAISTAASPSISSVAICSVGVMVDAIAATVVDIGQVARLAVESLSPPILHNVAAVG